MGQKKYEKFTLEDVDTAVPRFSVIEGQYTTRVPEGEDPEKTIVVFRSVGTLDEYGLETSRTLVEGPNYFKPSEMPDVYFSRAEFETYGIDLRTTTVLQKYLEEGGANAR